MPHIERHLAGHKGSYACLSDAASVDTAIVFVHGFWGGAASTWEQIASQMDVAIPHLIGAAARDFFFYDYKTRDDTVNGHAVEFLTFLRRLYPTLDPALLSPTGGRGRLARGIDALVSRLLRRPAVQAPALKRTGAISYSRLILVGHSMGGVIVRRALLNALASPYAATFTGTSLRLFAPAHAGFRQQSAASAAVGAAPGAGLLFALFALSNRAFNDLQPGSPILQALERDHGLLAGHSEREAAVIWAKGDFVVFDTLLAGDTEERVAGKDHRSVCKTRWNYLLPLEVVLR